MNASDIRIDAPLNLLVTVVGVFLGFFLGSMEERRRQRDDHKRRQKAVVESIATNLEANFVTLGAVAGTIASSRGVPSQRLFLRQLEWSAAHAAEHGALGQESQDRLLVLLASAEHLNLRIEQVFRIENAERMRFALSGERDSIKPYLQELHVLTDKVESMMSALFLSIGKSNDDLRRVVAGARDQEEHRDFKRPMRS